MSRELIEAAKAVCDDAERGTKGVITVFGEPQSMIDAHLVATLRAAVRAAEAAPVADTVQKRIPSKTMSAYVLEDCGHIKNEHGHIRTLDAVPGRPFFEVSCGAGCMVVGLDAASVATAWDLVATKRSAMPYIAPAPVADTVAVPIETLRELRLIATKPLTDQDCRNVCAAVRATVDALLPPPPAPEPSVPGDVIDQWNREAVDYANEQFPELPEVNRAARYGYVAARRAEWVRTQKGGG